MKRAYLFLFAQLFLIGFMLCQVCGCISTLTWKIERIKKPVKTEVAKVDSVKTAPIKEVKKKRIDVIRDTENGEWNRLMPPIK